MQPPPLYYRNKAEQRSVAWYKRSHKRGRWFEYALEEVAYAPRFARVDWQRSYSGVPRRTWVGWSSAPFGDASFNSMHQAAQLCIRRNAYFPDMAKRLGKRNWQ